MYEHTVTLKSAKIAQYSAGSFVNLVVQICAKVFAITFVKIFWCCLFIEIYTKAKKLCLYFTNFFCKVVLEIFAKIVSITESYGRYSRNEIFQTFVKINEFREILFSAKWEKHFPNPNYASFI